MPLTVGLGELHRFAASVLVGCGLPPASAETAADALCYAESRGYPTHGMSALLRTYAPGLRAGRIDPAARMEVVSRTGAVATVDGHRALGLVTAARAMDLAVAAAARYGVSVVAVRNSTHFGCAGAYAHRAAAAGAIGLALTNCGRQGVAPPLGGCRRLLGTNPLAAAVPAGRQPPFVLDMSTTVVAAGKVNAARRRGEPVPPGWLLRPDGSTTTDPAEYARGTADVAWLGGPAVTGGAKGFGLALLVDLLCGPLAGAGFGPHAAALDAPHPDDDDIGHVLIAVSPAAFGPRERFTAQVDEALATVAACPPAAYAERVAYPGLPEAERAARAAAGGVRLPDEVVDGLTELAGALGVAPLRPLAGAEGGRR